MDVSPYFILLLGFVVLQRITELLISRRNERWLRAQGAYEVGQRHYPFIVTLHVAFFFSLALEVVLFRMAPAAWWWIPFLLFAAAQTLRYWSIATLGRRWNTRVLILPETEPIRRGPYRYLRHPNYVAVAIELLCLPLIFQAYFTALIFTLLNAIMMSIRIPAEARALSQKAG